MSFSKSFFTISYLILLTLSVYTPRFGVFDKASIQYFLISISNILAFISFPLVFEKKALIKPLKSLLLLFYLGYVFMAILSMIKSINITESLVELSQIITIVTTLFMLLVLISERLIKINHILTIISLSLIVDIAFSLSAYIPFLINDISYTMEDNWRLVGLYGNRNILATTIAFRIPFLIILSNRLNKPNFYLLSFIISIIAFFNIMLLSSRATYLAIILCFVFIVFIIIIKYFKDRKNIFSANRSIILLYIIPSVIAYILSFQAIDSSTGSVTSRISTITSTNDTSKNTRLRYYSQSIDHISKNPFLGAGIGNWKIWSIKYDSENIQNYIIPYNAHNDILEAAAETGIIGGLSFLSFFLVIGYYLFKILRESIFSREKFAIGILLSLPFINYFIDLNLNFPSSRPINQFFLLMYICIILVLKFEFNEKE